MREARLVGLSQDGKTLILAVAETGEEFAVPVDDRLRAALRGDRARLGQLEIQMESALRPRDIQARIRAGESPEAVAAVAQMPMERVMAFAGPVLAERDHVASLAQRASVRRRGGGDAPTRNLGAWVTERLRIRGVDPASAEWDAWRRDDGRWAVRVSYFVDASEGDAGDEKVAMFAYDAPGRYAVPDDDEARWLVGEQAQVIAPPPTSERRLTAVADFDLSLAPDHGADSYEAGFEDTVHLTRGRAHQPDRAANRDTGRGFGRDAAPEYGQDPGREFGRDTGYDRETARDGSFGRDTGRDGGFGRDGGGGREAARDGGRDSGRDGGRDVGYGREAGPGRDFGREAGREAGPDFGRDPGREFGREVGRDGSRGGSGDGERGPRRVHSVPSPDDEPTLIDVPIEQPPAVRPAVRAVERPTQPPVEASPPAPLEERAAAPENRFTERRIAPAPPAPTQRTNQPRPTDPSDDPQTADSRPGDPREVAARAAGKGSQADSSRARETQVAEPAAAAEAEQPAEAEPKKKPAKRGSKRASVPSWDEIMFGKKAD